MKKSYIVDSTCNDMRIDRWIRNSLGNMPQGLIEKNLRAGKIKLNKKKIKSSHKVKINDEIDLFDIDFKETIIQKKIKFEPSKAIIKSNEDQIIDNNDNISIENGRDNPNYYELIPSGNINQKPMKNKKLEFNFDLINEFIEETGLNSKHIKKIAFLCIIKDKQNFVFDICNIIELNINKKNILKHFKSSEYSKPLFVPISLLPKFIEKNHKKIVPTSIGIIDHYLTKNKLFN